MWEEIDTWIESKKAVTAKVVKEVGAGLLANKNGIKLFIPASQLAERNADLKAYVGNNIVVRLLEVDKDKRKVFGKQLLKDKKLKEQLRR